MRGVRTVRRRGSGYPAAVPPPDSRAPVEPADLPDASAAGWSGHPMEEGAADATWPFEEGPVEGGPVESGSACPPALPSSRYVVGTLVGQGGMGRVYAARDVRLDREVALKEALPGTEARLAREARVTAWLDHPNIVPVHDVGRTAEGRAFYAMRLVRGRTLAAAFAAGPDGAIPDLAARLRHVRTLLAVADAVAFAHARGVVHRDLKPANILVGEFGETQVMDWGVARVLGRAEVAGAVAAGARAADAPTAVPRVDVSDPPDAALTGAGGVVGTPRYMCPEQAHGARVDPRADVWSLGAMLYELLAGAPPYGGSRVEALAAARAGIVPPLRDRAPDAPAELVAIAERALRPDPDERYPTARAFAADLEAWLDGRRVGAHAYTQRELVGRLVRAWRVPLGVAAVAAVLLGVGGAVATARVVAERDRARAAETVTAGALVDAEESLARALVARALTALEGGDQPAAELAAARALTLRESADARGVLAAFALGERPRLLSRSPAPSCEVARLGDDPRAIWCDDDAGSGLWDSDPGAWRWRVEGGHAALAGRRVYLTEPGVDLPVPRVVDLATGQALPERFAALRGIVLGAARDGGALLAGRDEQVRLVEPGLAEDAEVARCPPGVRAQVARSEGPWQVVACNGGALLVWGDGPPRTLPPTLPTPTALAILGDAVVVGSAGGAIQVRDLRTGALRAAGDSGLGPVRAIEPWPGGAGVAVLGDRGVGWWDTDTAALHLRLARRDLRALAVADGSLWVLGTALERWSAPAVPPARVFESPNGVGGVVIDTSGERLLAYGGGGDVRVWTVADGRLVGDHRLQDGVTKAAGFGPAGGVVAVAASTPGLAWHTPGAGGASKAAAPPFFRDLRYRRVFALRSGWTALFDYGGEVSFVRWGGAAPSSAARLGGTTLDAALAPDATWGAVLDERGGVHRIEGDPPTARPWFTDPGAGALAVAAGGRVTTITQDEVRVFDATGARVATFAAAGLRDVAMSPDGRRVAAGSAGGVTYVWDLPEGADAGEVTLRAVLHGHTARVQGVAFSPDGRWLATGSWDGTTRRWGLAVLDAAPDALQKQLEGAWGRTLEDVEGS